MRATEEVAGCATARQHAQGLTEYALIIAFISIAAIALVIALGGLVLGLYTSVVGQLP